MCQSYFTPSNKIKQSLKLSNISCVSNGMGDRLTLKAVVPRQQKVVESSPHISSRGK